MEFLRKFFAVVGIIVLAGQADVFAMDPQVDSSAAASASVAQTAPLSVHVDPMVQMSRQPLRDIPQLHDVLMEVADFGFAEFQKFNKVVAAIKVNLRLLRPEDSFSRSAYLIRTLNDILKNMPTFEASVPKLNYFAAAILILEQNFVPDDRNRALFDELIQFKKRLYDKIYRRDHRPDLPAHTFEESIAYFREHPEEDLGEAERSERILRHEKEEAFEGDALRLKIIILHEGMLERVALEHAIRDAHDKAIEADEIRWRLAAFAALPQS